MALKLLRVRGGSMWPVLRAGDRVLVRAPGPGEPRPGQIVLVQSDLPLLHRVVDTAPGFVVTRGDAQPEPEPPWPLASVRGVAELRLRDRKARLLTADPPSRWGRLACLVRGLWPGRTYLAQRRRGAEEIENEARCPSASPRAP